MSPEQFRTAAYQHADWISDYFQRIREFPVTTPLKPGELVRALPDSAPETGEPIEKIFADFQSTVFPALTLWNHPRFFAYFSISGTPPSILADFLASTLNVNAMLWKSAPGATELEQVTLSWLRQWLALDESFFGQLRRMTFLNDPAFAVVGVRFVDPNGKLAILGFQVL